jgi:biopolymer transport protein ExbD
MASKRETPEVGAGSMADIAFLLLVFFLMVTTIETNEGIQRKLPPFVPPEQELEINVKQRNIFDIRINASDRLLVEGKIADISQLKEMTKEFIMNPGKSSNLAEKPELAIVSIKNDRGTSYGAYITVQDILTQAYNELRDEQSRIKYGKDFDELTEEEQDVIKDIIPMKVSEAEPEDLGGN